MESEILRERLVRAAAPCLTTGTVPCCMEAQADGVPCFEIRDCETCGRAVRPSDPWARLATAP